MSKIITITSHHPASIYLQRQQFDSKWQSVDRDLFKMIFQKFQQYVRVVMNLIAGSIQHGHPVSGLCTEGAMEAAISAIQKLDVGKIVKQHQLK